MLELGGARFGLGQMYGFWESAGLGGRSRILQPQYKSIQRLYTLFSFISVLFCRSKHMGWWSILPEWHCRTASSVTNLWLLGCSYHSSSHILGKWFILRVYTKRIPERTTTCRFIARQRAFLFVVLVVLLVLISCKFAVPSLPQSHLIDGSWYKALQSSGEFCKSHPQRRVASCLSFN